MTTPLIREAMRRLYRNISGLGLAGDGGLTVHESMPFVLGQSVMVFVFPKTKRLLFGLAAVMALGACRPAPQPTAVPPAAPEAPQPAAPAAPNESQPAASDLAAEVAAVEALPVTVKAVDQAQETDALVGMALAYGDTIRTAEAGLAQIDLVNGLAFRIGGEASLTLQPSQELQLDSGEMLVWVEPGQEVPTQIVTPVGAAGLRGTTLFVRVPDDPDEGVVFFAWEGEIRLRFEGDTEDLILNAGEELRVRPGERLRDLRGKVRRLRRREIRQQRRQSRLLNGFRQPLPTQSQLEQTIEAAPVEP
jgi:hypothetical protein